MSNVIHKLWSHSYKKILETKVKYIQTETGKIHTVNCTQCFAMKAFIFVSSTSLWTLLLPDQI